MPHIGMTTGSRVAELLGGDVMRLVDKQRRGMCCHLLTDRCFGAAGDLHCGDDDIGAVEDLVHLGYGRRNVRKAHHHGKCCPVFQALLLPRHAEGLDLARDLLALGVCRHHYR